jgi:hypothetical protein
MGDFLTIPEFAKRMKLCPTTVYVAVQQKRVQSIKILGRIGIPKSEIERFKRRKNGDNNKVLKKVAA